VQARIDEILAAAEERVAGQPGSAVEGAEA
jgi:hypothetical protein